MPNWVFNGLTIEGKPESVNKLVAQMNQPFKVHSKHVWDRELGQSVAKDVLYPNPVFSFWNIYSPLQDNVSLDEYQEQPKRSELG